MLQTGLLRDHLITACLMAADALVHARNADLGSGTLT